MAAYKKYCTEYLTLFRFITREPTFARQVRLCSSVNPGNQDIVGPPNPKSNLRLIKFHVPADETTEEKLYRQKREKIQEWNQSFWTAHNASFVEEKEKFVNEKLREKALSCSENTALSSDEMSVFYKRFLNENYEKHSKYNKEWHRKNISLLIPGIKAVISRWRKNLS